MTHRHEDELTLSTKLLRGLLGGTANAISMIFTNPLDVLKIRFQTSEGTTTATRLRTQSTLQKAISIVRIEGIFGLYKGLTISMLRELTFSSGRVGLYEPCKALLTPKGQHEIGGVRKIFAGLLSGAISAAICNPTDVVKIRFQGDPAPLGQPRRYPSVRNAFVTIWKNEGLRSGLYKGVVTTTARSAVLSATQLASYDIFKHNIFLKCFPSVFSSDGFLLHFCASFCAGVMTTLASNPLDIARTRIMNEQATIIYVDGKLISRTQYSSNPLVTMFIIVKKEGPMALYKGFVPSYVRLGTCTVIFFIIYEQLRRMVGIKGI